ncbi:hypothetical protein WA026_017975, partial [Henosepilachna vigintioctopunctata]
DSLSLVILTAGDCRFPDTSLCRLSNVKARIRKLPLDIYPNRRINHNPVGHVSAEEGRPGTTEISAAGERDSCHSNRPSANIPERLLSHLLPNPFRDVCLFETNHFQQDIPYNRWDNDYNGDFFGECAFPQVI